MKIPAFDPILVRLSAAATSIAEPEALAELWSHGEDAWLREDPRFRPTPWGRWVPSDRYLVNDLLVHELREGRSELSLSEQLKVLAKVIRRPTAICPADPRLCIEDDSVRLAPSELTADPLIERDIGPLLRFVTHLPVLSLKVAAASRPAGAWGQEAEPQEVREEGWLRVDQRAMNRRMFVAQVKGASMEPTVEDGDWALFEFTFSDGVTYDGDGRPVLVRWGAPLDELGSYAVKKLVTGPESLLLVSSNRDEERYPDITIPPEEEDHLRVIATFQRALTPSDFGRRPKPVRRRGRRVVEGQAGLHEQRTRLARRIDAFFEGRLTTDDEADAQTATGWQTRVVCLDPESGGLHLEVGPLDGLPPFVRKLRVVGAEDRDGILLAANARSRPASLAMAPGSGPWRWEAVGFEDEEDLGLERLRAPALPSDSVSVFRVDAAGVGKTIAGTQLSLGQVYRLLLPPGLGDETTGDELAEGWRLWTLDLSSAPPSTVRMQLEALGLGVGEAWPRLEWALAPPAAWQSTPRGEVYPVFEAGTEVAVRVRGLPDEEEGSAYLFLCGPAGVERLELPPSGSPLVSLDVLAQGRWACSLVHPRTEVRTTTLVFEVAEDAFRQVDADWSATDDLSTLQVSAPPGWPVTLSWRVLRSVRVGTVHADSDSTVDMSKLLPIVEERARRARVGDLVIDLDELGRLVVQHDGRPSVESVRDGLASLWTEREGLVRGRRGAWLVLVPHWFKPVCELFGYTLEELVAMASAGADDGLAAWRLIVDEREPGGIRRSAARVLVLTEDLDATLAAGLEAVAHACSAADVREAIVTDGIRWTTHRKNNRMRQPEWDLGEALSSGEVEEMLAALAEGLG
ncbi:MAG: S24 family peptidase [Alphaproteobacteria bacterium]|nr:S24 family peptidase [Alphaproteobacteria bacterium]